MLCSNAQAERAGHVRMKIAHVKMQLLGTKCSVAVTKAMLEHTRWTAGLFLQHFRVSRWTSDSR